jgi:hypothetical protein
VRLLTASALAFLALGAAARVAAAPVTREEAAALLAALDAAHAREDEKAVQSAYRGLLAVRAGKAVRELFRDRNRIVLVERIDAAHQDGEALETEVVATMRSRRATESSDRAEKRRLLMRFERDEHGPFIESAAPAEQGVLASSRSWRARSLTGTVTLSPEDLAQGRARVAIEVRLSNEGASPSDEIAFLLHPFASDVVVTAQGQPLTMTRIEGAVDAWRGKLAAPVAALSSLDVEIAYAVDQAGEDDDCAITPGLVRLYQRSAWLPQFSPPTGDDASRVTHDILVLAPPGLVTAMPGIRSSEPAKDGLAGSRFRSVLPAAEVALVGVAGTLETEDLGGGITLEVVRRAGGADPAGAIGIVVSLAAFLEDQVGPCPVPRIVLAEAGGSMREAPGFMALPTLDLRKLDAGRLEEDDAWLFMARSLGRAFLLYAPEASGPGAAVVLSGLIDHLAGDWAGAAIHAEIPVRQRAEVLAEAAPAAFLDQPLVPMVPGPPPDEFFGRGKARMLFDMLAEMEGGAALDDAVAAWRREARPGASIEELLRRLGGSPERDALIETFARRQGFADVFVADVRMRALTAEEAKAQGVEPGVLQQVEIVVSNRGVGPVPVPLRVEVDGRNVTTKVIVPGGGSAAATLVAASLPVRIRLDPDHVIWQVALDDDAWPTRLPKERDVSKVQLGVSDKIFELPIERGSPPRKKKP